MPKPTNGTEVDPGRRQGFWEPAWLMSILYGAGFLHWLLFFKFGNLTFRAHDWAKEFIYLSLLKQWTLTGKIPYHVNLAFHGTHRFLAIPEINLSPQILLLAFLDVGKFILVNTLILYSLGFLGCLLLKQRYGLKATGFTFLFLIFNFNGHLIAHIGVGHSMWVGYFLLPFYLVFLLELLDRPSSKSSPLKLALIMLVILLQGAFHIFIWCLTFLILLLIFNWNLFRPLIKAIGLSLVAGAFRLVPAGFALIGKKEKFIWSYPTVRDLLDSLVTIREQTPERLKPWGTTGWWEYDVYVGLIGLALIVTFGILMRFSKRKEIERYRYPELDLPSFAMAVLSISYIHAFITRIPFPVLKSERVATRFIIIPFLVVTALAAIRMDKLLEHLKSSLRFKVIAAGLVALMGLSFVDHSYLWSVARLERIYAKRVVDLRIPALFSKADVTYKSILWISLAITVACVAYLVRNLAAQAKKAGGARTKKS